MSRVAGPTNNTEGPVWLLSALYHETSLSFHPARFPTRLGMSQGGEAMTNNGHSPALSADSLQIPHLKIERSLHQEFEHERVDGEWFALDADDIVTVTSSGGEA